MSKLKLFQVGVFIAAVAVFAITSFLCVQKPAVAAASDVDRAWLESNINISKADANAVWFNVLDDAGHTMHCAKVIPDPCGGYFAVYHWYNGAFYVGLAQSTNMSSWHYVRTLSGSGASQPYIYADNNGGYVLTWEQEPANHCYFQYYSTRSSLLSSSPSYTFSAPRQLSSYAEGTPTIDYVKWNGTFGDIANSTIYVEFHYYKNGWNDKNAYAYLTNFNSWSSSANTSFDNAIEAWGYQEVGQTERLFTPQHGYQFDLVEATHQANDWPDWKIFVYDWQTGGADRLDMATAAGSTVFANPRATQLISPTKKAAYLVTLFMPSEGNIINEVGEAIYYVNYSDNLLVNGDFEEIRPDNNPPINWRFIASGGATGTWASTTGVGEYTSGLHGMKISYSNPSTGDSSLDLVPSIGGAPGGVPVPVSRAHVYKLSADAKNASGQYTFNSAIQALSSTGTISSTTSASFGQYFSKTWQRFEMSARMLTNTSLSVRFDVKGTQISSAYIDNAALEDITTSNRVLNCGFENSTIKPLQWTLTSSNGATGSLALSPDANSGVSAGLMTVTSAGQGDISMDSDKSAVIAGETLYITYAGKKISGPEGSQLRLDVKQWDANGQLVVTTYSYLASPKIGSYANCVPSSPITIATGVAAISLSLRICGADGSSLVPGACLIDDVYVGRTSIVNPVTVSVEGSKELSDGTVMRINGEAVSGVWDGFFYVESADRLSGIRVVVPSQITNPVTALGVNVIVNGTMQTNEAGERYILASDIKLAS